MKRPDPEGLLLPKPCGRGMAPPPMPLPGRTRPAEEGLLERSEVGRHVAKTCAIHVPLIIWQYHTSCAFRDPRLRCCFHLTERGSKPKASCGHLDEWHANQCSLAQRGMYIKHFPSTSTFPLQTQAHLGGAPPAGEGFPKTSIPRAALPKVPAMPPP